MAIRSTSGQSTSPRRAERSARRPTTVAAAPSAEPTRKPTCQMRSSRHDGGRGRTSLSLAHRTATLAAGPAAAPDPARSTCWTSRNAEPNRRLASAWNASASPVVSWRWTASRGCSSGRAWPPSPGSAAVPRVVPGASRPLTLSNSARRRRGRRRRIDDRDPVADVGGDDRPQQRVVGAAEKQRIDRRSGRLREDRFARGVALADERRERICDGRLGESDPTARPPRRAGRGPASRARRPPRPDSRP